jgi:hypothetical protein
LPLHHLISDFTLARPGIYGSVPPQRRPRRLPRAPTLSSPSLGLSSCEERYGGARVASPLHLELRCRPPEKQRHRGDSDLSRCGVTPCEHPSNRQAAPLLPIPDHRQELLHELHCHLVRPRLSAPHLLASLFLSTPNSPSARLNPNSPLLSDSISIRIGS